MSGITNPAEPYFKDGLWGWDGTTWRKLQLLWGYYDRWQDVLNYTMLADENYVRYSTAVPAGYVYKLEMMAMNNNTAVRGAQYMSVRYAAIPYHLVWKDTSERYVPVLFSGSVTLKEGDQVMWGQLDCITGDVIRTAAWGYKMKIAE